LASYIAGPTGHKKGRAIADPAFSNRRFYS
jgi:hypothetical protein